MRFEHLVNSVKIFAMQDMDTLKRWLKLAAKVDLLRRLLHRCRKYLGIWAVWRRSNDRRHFVSRPIFYR